MNPVAGASLLARAVAAAVFLPVTAVLLLALAWPVLVLVLTLDLLWWPIAALARMYRPSGSPPPRRDASAASIVVVSWNGKHFLERLLPTLTREVEAHGGDHEVIVVDNGSEDGSVPWLRREYPTIKVVALPENRFFVRGNMAGVRVATRDILVFLNNDMEVRPGFLGPLLEGFRDPDVFAVSAEVFFRDPEKRREETGLTRGEVRRGSLKLAHRMPSRDQRELEYVPTFWAGGGSSAFDRKRFLEIGGFDTLYDPFYMEDTGLSYQAWKRGGRLLFTARSAVVHEHRGTSRKAFGDDYVDSVIRRNQHLFVWRNITDPALLAACHLLLPAVAAGRALTGPRPLLRGLWFELRAFLRALPRLPVALKGRCGARRYALRSDRRVFSIANDLRAYRQRTGAGLGRLPAPSAEGLRILVLSGRIPRKGIDGSWTVFNRLADQAKRHRLTLLAFVESRSEEEAATPLREVGIHVIPVHRSTNPLPLNSHHLVPHRLERDYGGAELEQAVREALESTDWDLVQVEYSEMAFVAHRLLRGRPAIYVCHEPLGVFFAREWRTAKRTLSRLLLASQYPVNLTWELSMLRSFRQVVTLSGRDEAFLRSYLPGLPIETIVGGVQLPPRMPGGEREEARVLFVGYYRHSPNITGALWLGREVFPKVRSEVDEAKLVLIGRQPPYEVAELRSDGVEVPGYVADLSVEMERAAVVAIPIQSGGGMRGKVLEAWAAGKAVVATRMACEGFDVVDGEHLLLADEPEEFASALVRCLRDAHLRRKLAAAGWRLAEERYSTSAVTTAFDALYPRLTNGDPT